MDARKIKRNLRPNRAQLKSRNRNVLARMGALQHKCKSANSIRRRKKTNGRDNPNRQYPMGALKRINLLNQVLHQDCYRWILKEEKTKDQLDKVSLYNEGKPCK